MRLKDSPPLPHNFSYGPSLMRLPTEIQFRDPSPSDFWRSYASQSLDPWTTNNLRFEFDWTASAVYGIWFSSTDRVKHDFRAFLSLRSTALWKTLLNVKKWNIQANTTSVAPPFTIVLFASLKLKLHLFFSYFNLIFRCSPLFSSKKPQWNRTTLAPPPPPPSPPAYPKTFG